MPFIVTAGGSDALTYRQTRASYLWTPTRGVRALITERSWHDQVRALALVLPERAVFSHTTAAQLHELPLPVTDPRPIHVTTDGTRGRRQGVVWHRKSLSGTVEFVSGLPVTSPVRTLLDLADLLDLVDLVVVADVLLRRSLCSIDEIQVRGRRHARRLRQVAERADGRSRSPRETMLRLAFADAGLPQPELNMSIIEAGVWIGEGDWVWPEYRVIADYDGEHHSLARQRHQDAQTRDDYAASGWRHVTVTSRMGLRGAVERVARALRGRGWRA